MEKNSNEQFKKSNNQAQEIGVQEVRRMMDENEVRQQYRDQQFGQRYNHFKEFQKKADENYIQQVKQAEMDKASRINQMIRKGEMEAKAKEEMDLYNRENANKNWRMNNKATLEKQMFDKRSGKQAGQTEFQVDYNNRVNHEKNLNEIEYLEKSKKKEEQNKYKEMLDTQLKIAKQRQLYGNMTGVEKSLNKDDLIAWKKYDHTTYALIPGLNSSKKPVSDRVLEDKMSKKRERSYDNEIHRMNQFGLTRDVVKARDYQPIPFVKSNKKLSEGNAYSVDPRASKNVSTAQARTLDSPSLDRKMGSPAKVLSSEVPNRSLLASSGHKKYPNHHLFSNYNPISGAFSQVDNAANKSIFKNAGGNMFF